MSATAGLLEDFYPVSYDPTLDADAIHGAMSLPRPGGTKSSAATWQDKYAPRKVPGYTGYIPGAKFGMARTPYPTQVEAKMSLRANLVPSDLNKEYGFEQRKPLPNVKTLKELPNLHPDDHSFADCRPPDIQGNPSNKHNMTFGDNRVPGTYSERTTYRETFRGPKAKLIINGETPLTEIYRTAEELKEAYDRAVKKAGKTKMSGILKAMSDRVNAKLTNNGASAFQMRKKIERLTESGTDIVRLDEMRKLMMVVLGITLEEDDLLALFGMYDVEVQGYISITDLMRVLVDVDYFRFFLGNHIQLDKELINVKESDKAALRVVQELGSASGDLLAMFDEWDINKTGHISRSELVAGLEKRGCPISPAGLQVVWQASEAKKYDFMFPDEFARAFSASYSDYIGIA